MRLFRTEKVCPRRAPESLADTSPWRARPGSHGRPLMVPAWLVAVAAALAAISPACHEARTPTRQPQLRHIEDGSIRAIWVTRWDYGRPTDIVRIMENCQQAGFNTILFQVRGNGTVMYPSRMEPWAKQLGGKDPGFDPLAMACREAHRRGLRLHAWANVMPGWRGKKTPANKRQLYHTRPDWFLRDASGRRQPLGWYASLNPCYPEVRRYLVDVMREIVSRYPVDGLHLDYIRFPNERSVAYRGWDRVPDYPRDPRTLAMFRSATGKTPDAAPGLWTQWRGDQVTQLVRDIRNMMRNVRPRAQLTAAVGASPSDAKRNHFQDSPSWIAHGLIDAVYPMNYTDNMRMFGERIDRWSRLGKGFPIVTGIMADGRDSTKVVEQIQRAQQTGSHVAVFAYNALFERLDGAGRPMRDKDSPARATRRQSVGRKLRRQGN